MSGRFYSAKVSHEMVAEIANAVQCEIDFAFGGNSTKKLQSGNLIGKISHGYTTGHAAAGTRAAMEMVPSIVATLDVTYINISPDREYPVILPSSYVKALAANQKLNNLTGGQPLSCLTTFWQKMRPLRPNHPVYELPEDAWKHIIPVYLIADEGRGFKKTGIMVLGFEPILGYGCDVEDETTASEPIKMNFRGNTFKTRLLFTVVPKAIYNKDATPLHELINQWADDFRNCFSGLEVNHEDEAIKLRIAVLGLKGDWPALSKLGRLERSYAREAYPFGKGICHLCSANTSDCPQWHHHDFAVAPWVATMASAELPWIPARECGLTMKIPMEPDHKAQFFLVDIFHTCHKGVHADLAGSGIDAGLTSHIL